MGTLIKSISFQNFYNYYGSYEDNTYTFTEGINIINADNNMGKSKFYNGFLWILRDEVYDSDEKKYYPVSASYFKMMSAKARYESPELEMGVRIIYENDGITYNVCKSVLCKKQDDEWDYQARTDVMKTEGNNDLPLLDKDEKLAAIRCLIPAEMEKYSLLQGESMERLVDLSTLDGLEKTINVLADINNLIKMCGLASELVKQAKKSYQDEEKRNKEADEGIIRLRQERDNYEKWIEEAKEKIELARKESVEAKEKEQQYESDFFSSKKRIQLRKEYDEECKKLKELKDKHEQQELSITSRLFDENCPWLLYGLVGETSDFDDYRIALTKQIAKKEIQENPDIMLPEGSPDAPSLKRMLEHQWCEVCNREAPRGSEPWLHIKKVMERPKEPMRVSDSFMQFYGDIQKSTGRYETTIPKIADDYTQYMSEIFNLEEQIEQQVKVVEAKENELTLVGSETSTDDDDRRVLAGYNQAKKTHEEKEEEIQRYTSKIDLWQKGLDKAMKELDKRQGSAPIRKAKQLYEDMQVVESIFYKTKERIFEEIVSKLQVSANEMYGALTKGNQTFGGTLNFVRQENGTVKVSVTNSFGDELFGNGTGFQRMKQLAIVMSIISSKVGNKSFEYPFISDAPFSEFSLNFIRNFFDVAPNVFRQCIIMIKDLCEPNNPELLITKHGEDIAEKMRTGEIKGTFYVNYPEERADASNLVTKKKCYSE